MRAIAPLAVLAALAAAQTAVSAQTMNVQSLMSEGYTVAGTVSSPGQAGVFLHKGNALVFCFIAESPVSPMAPWSCESRSQRLISPELSIGTTPELTEKLAAAAHSPLSRRQ